MPANRKVYITLVASVIWFFGIIALYYVSHKPFTPELVAYVLIAMWRLIIATALTALAGGIGWLIYRDKNLNPLAQLAIQMAIGMGILALLVLLLGVTLGLTGWLLGLMLVLALILLRRPVFFWAKQWSNLKELWQTNDRFCQAAAVLVSLLLFCAMLLSLAPPVKYDALVYHLLLPDVYLRAGRIAYIPWLMKTGMPQTAEMLYTWSMALGGAAASAVIGWMTGVVTITGLLGYLQTRLGTRAAWAGVIALLGGFSLPAALSWAYVDWWCLMFGFGALVGLDEWRQNGGGRRLVLVGLMAGFALGTKYPAGILGLAAGVAFLWHLKQRRERFFSQFIRFSVPAILAPLPWFIKNLISTGNPIYPLFFESGAMDAVRQGVYQATVPWGSWGDILFLPFFATYMGHEGASGYGASIGPLLLALGALAWLGWRHRPAAQKLAIVNASLLAVVAVIAWTAGNQLTGYLVQTRFYFSIFPAFAFLAAAGFDALSRIQIPRLRIGRIAAAMVLFVAILNTIEVGLFAIRQRVPQAVLGIESSDAYVAHNLGWYQVAMQSLLDLPEETQVLMLLEPRAYYCQPRCKPDETLDRWQRDWRIIASLDQIHSSWLEEGFTHVLFYRAGADFLRSNDLLHYTEQEWAALDSLLGNLQLVEDFDQAYSLYEIK
jgi:hypothetical protein